MNLRQHLDLEKLEKQAHDARNRGRTAEAIDLYNKLFEAFEKQAEYERAGQQLQMIGVCYKIDNLSEKSLAALQRAADYFREHGFDRGFGNTLRDIGITYAYIDRLEEAEHYLQESREILERVGDQGGQGITLAKIGLIQTRKRQFKAAEQILKEAIKVLDKGRDVAGRDPNWFYRATAIGHLGALYIEMREYKKAIERLIEAKTIFDEHPTDGHSRRYAQYYGLIAHCQAQLEHYEEAITHYKQAIDLLFDGSFSPTAAAVVLRDIKAAETIALLAKL